MSNILFSTKKIGSKKMKIKRNKLNLILFLLFGLLGLLSFVYIWFFMPHSSAIESVWQMSFKIFAFMLIILSISFFPTFKNAYLLLILPSLIFLGYLIPRISYFGFSGAASKGDAIASGEFYTILYLLLFPAILMTVTLAYRLGGGASGKTFKVAFSGVILLFSGFLDLLWPIANGLPIPEKLIYAHHVAVFLGPDPSYKATIVFALFHLPLLLILILLPLDKYFNRMFDLISE